MELSARNPLASRNQQIKTDPISPLTHWAENIGTTTMHMILVELKNPS